MKRLIAILFLTSLAAGVFALPNLLKKEEFGANAIENLDFSLTMENLKIEETLDSSIIEVEIYCNYKKFIPEVSVSGSTLYIESSRKGVSFFPNPTGLSCTLIVYVPQKKDFREIDIHASSGDIEISRQLSAKDKICITTSSGDINSNKGLFADEITVNASSGDIDLYNIDADEFKVHTTSGDCTVRKFTGEEGDIHSTSGDIKADDFASEYAKFSSTSGSISVKKLDCDYFDVDSTSGSITIELKNAPAASSSIGCTSGDVDLYLPLRSKFSVEVSCTSGTFRDKFNNNRMNPRETYKMDYNGGGSVIKLHTTSGDITLDY